MSETLRMKVDLHFKIKKDIKLQKEKFSFCGMLRCIGTKSIGSNLIKKKDLKQYHWCFNAILSLNINLSHTKNCL